MLGLKKSGLVLSAVFTLAGCNYQNVEHSHSHGHDHGHIHDYDDSYSHSHSHSHSLHHGVLVPLFSAQQKVGYAELKLHDDKGDLELWLTVDKAGANPLDMGLNSEVRVSFPKLSTQQVQLRVRNTEKNEDEDGKGNLRGNNTNYFIFPGDTGVDAAFLTGKEFASDAVISFEKDGVQYTTDVFVLRPHTH